MLALKSLNKISFNVNVYGTNDTPEVRCVIGETPMLSFKAVQIKNEAFEVLINLPKDFIAGEYPFKIEVLLNGRLFTPISRQISVLEEVQDSITLQNSQVQIKVEETIPEIRQTKYNSTDDSEKLVTPVPVNIKKAKPSIIANIAAMSEKLEPLEHQAVKSPIKKARVFSRVVPDSNVVESNPSSIPVSLTKGNIIFR